MKRVMVIFGSLGLGLASLVGTGASRAVAADVDSVTQGASGKVLTAPFTVESVDLAKRSLVVRSRDGFRATMKVAAQAAGLDTVKPGDNVQLDYYPSSVLALNPTSPAATPTAVERPTRATAPPLQPTGRQVTTTARVSFIDNLENTLELTTPEGRPEALTVQDAALQRQLAALRPTEEVTVTYTEPLAVGLRHLTGGGKPAAGG